MAASPTTEAPPAMNGARRSWQSVANAWVPVLVCVLVIATESTAAFGADRTTGPLRRLLELFFGPFTQPQWWRLHLAIRKGGHFLGYGMLSIAWFRAWWMTLRASASQTQPRALSHALAMSGTLLVASCDEFHQTFLPNRTGSFWDVLVDCSGALLMQALIWLWMWQRSSRAA